MTSSVPPELIQQDDQTDSEGADVFSKLGSGVHPVVEKFVGLYKGPVLAVKISVKEALDDLDEDGWFRVHDDEGPGVLSADPEFLALVGKLNDPGVKDEDFLSLLDLMLEREKPPGKLNIKMPKK